MSEAGKADGGSSAARSYDAELSELIWARTRLVCLIGLVVSLAAVPAASLLDDPSLATSDGLRVPSMYLHALTFLVGLGIVYAWRGAGLSPWLAAVLLAVGLAFMLLTQTASERIESSKSAIVMAVESAVRNEPGTNGMTLFMLHEGTKVTVIERNANHWKVQLANGNTGWIAAGDLTEI